MHCKASSCCLCCAYLCCTHKHSIAKHLIIKGLLQAPDSKSVAPATVIASYIGYPFLDADDRALALESLSALGEAAALLPSVCFAACLPAGPGQCCMRCLTRLSHHQGCTLSELV